MKSGKVGLLNIQRCDSHGAVLLAYAMETVLRKYGYEVETINYKYAGQLIEKNFIKKIYHKILLKWKKQFRLVYVGKKIGTKSVKKEYDIQHMNFKRFRSTYLHLTSEIISVTDPIINSYDTIIVGSDVVWKPEIVRCIDREIYFLLSPKKEIKKIAYAASIGTDDIDYLQKYSEYYKGAFDELDFISVRELSSISFIEKYTTKKVNHVIDPVFLLHPKEYIPLEHSELKEISERYIYVYALSDNSQMIRLADDFAKRNGLFIIVDMNGGFENIKIFTQPFESVISAGPAEFLYNIRHASYVFTDSFHATAFSLLFNIPFWVFKRGNISVRMTDLLEMFFLDNRFVTNIIDNGDINWDQVNKIIEKKREEGLTFLYSALVKKKKTEDND